MQPLYKIQG